MSGIVIYQAKDGRTQIEVQLEKETVWLDAHRLAILFGRERSVILKHINNIYNSLELDRDSTCAKIAQVAADSKQREMLLYNLDVIIGVGYRVNSKEGTRFRIWATNVLRKHLVDGWTLNEKRLKEARTQVKELTVAIDLVRKTIEHYDPAKDEIAAGLDIIGRYAQALGILDDYDHQRLSVPRSGTRSLHRLEYGECRKIIEAMRSEFSSVLFGTEKDDSLKSSIAAIYQTYDGKDVYPSAEEKAAHLLYFVVKNHSFVDGNKRIAAALFVYFLARNGIMSDSSGSRRIDDNTLVALTLMIAISDPKDKAMMINVAMNLLQARE